MADDRVLAQISGIDVNRVILVTWVISGLTAGLAGVLAALVQSSFDPNFGFQLLLPVFAAVVLGGIGSAYGALAGGLVLGVATELSTWEGFAGGVDPVYKPVVAFSVLIVALLLRPQGLFGRARVV
jgi:branched-subunit amino acid ABC-type transport system permease component